MSAAAIWRTGCCKRWFVYGRFRGNVTSSSGFALLMHCPPCLGKDRRVAAEFMGYTSDDKLKQNDAKSRFLEPSEIKRFVDVIRRHAGRREASRFCEGER
jgi:hypothetical protein